MKTSLIAVGAISVVCTLSGCARTTMFPGPGTNPDHCKQTNATCFLDVYQDAKGWHVDPDTMHVSDGARDVKLVWRLPDGYAFCDSDAVQFKKETQGQFDDGKGDGVSGHGKKQYQWRDRNTVKDTFPYKVTFHSDDCSGAAVVVDPDVVNEM